MEDIESGQDYFIRGHIQNPEQKDKEHYIQVNSQGNVIVGVVGTTDKSQLDASYQFQLVSSTPNGYVFKSVLNNQYMQPQAVNNEEIAMTESSEVTLYVTSAGQESGVYNISSDATDQSSLLTMDKLGEGNDVVFMEKGEDTNARQRWKFSKPDTASGKKKRKGQDK